MREQVNGNGNHPNGYHGSHPNGYHGSHPDSHPDRKMMVDYVTGSSSSEGRKEIEDHCLDCLTCRSQLSTLLHLIVSSADDYERRELDQLLTLGQQAAANAREIIRRQEQWNRRATPSWTSLGKRLQVLRPVLLPALVIVALLGGSLVAYLSLWRQSSEDLALARLREVYRNNRLLQARVTGDFAHQQYVMTRGPGDPTGVDESQRIALLSELNQEILAHQRAATRHNLGRLFMLQG